MILTGNEDLRVVKTIQGIKAAFEELMCEKDYAKITVKELCERSRINKKTFYHYYETLDALLSELQGELSADYLERIKGYTLPQELDKVNRTFFEYSAQQGLAYERITCSATYHSIRDEMVREVSDAGWSNSPQYQSLTPFEQRALMDVVNNAVLGIYRQWVEDGKRFSVEEIITLANKMVLGGVNGFFERSE